ncbi:hypothetical protein BVC80_1827g72 [Macleaya cordata]|uniref:LOB domain-containing protein n=1 Tax=Macleaya cordata TaxID=56857 RepID=A0A200QBG0_MACCD|nr:hypothetical protein BVC80_1827g72 [Macleaya cordata]
MMMMMSSSGSSSSGSGGGGGPCGACKFLRRKCVKGCIFAPYFDSEQGSNHFAAVHKVFGASNVSKLLLRIPVHKRLDAVVTICYEALARIRDPVYGCVGHIFALQQQVVNLQAELAFVQAHLSTFEHLPSHHQAAAVMSSAQSSAMVNVHNSSTNILSTSNVSTHFSSLQSQQQTNLETASCCSPTEQLPLHMNIDDGDLQTLAREFVSRYLPAEVKFQTSNSC